MNNEKIEYIVSNFQLQDVVKIVNSLPFTGVDNAMKIVNIINIINQVLQNPIKKEIKPEEK